MPNLVNVDEELLRRDPARRGGGKRLYDFNEWFHRAPGDDGKVRVMLVRHRDYECSQSSMIQQLRIAASHCGVRLSIVDMDDRVSVVVVPKEVLSVVAPI